MKKLAVGIVAIVIALAPVSSADAKPKPWHDHKPTVTTHAIDWD